MQKPKTFKQIYPIQRRIKIFEESKLKNPKSYIVIVEKDPKCKALPHLKHNRFSIDQDQKMMEVCNAIRSRIVAVDEKYKNQPFFLFTNLLLPNKQLAIKEIYEKNKDPEDGLLYFKYSNVDPFGF